MLLGVIEDVVQIEGTPLSMLGSTDQAGESRLK